ncbi:MAG: exodeoxyribonuclease VII large subunit [Rhodospirillaceae bacterium]|nr:exodeoxyribonuclease VII large subunit [Rhodospirillaceae bacterium]
MNDDTSISNPAENSGANAEHNLPVYGVGEVSQALKMTVEQTFSRVRVRGEVSGLKRAASGHMYFTLKDDAAVLDGVCWSGTASKMRMQPEDGMEVIVTGRLTTYPARSRYQIVVESFELAGEGALLKLLEDRRRQLAAEGLFDADRKQELPFLPRVIGVVTSPTGSVIRDILHRLADRFPSHVLVWPVLVQGDGAAEQIAAAIEGFNALGADGGAVPRPDLVIVARGGGSLEDLWAFNEEVVVRAAAESDIALISAVGHETDTTLIDFASDQRAPTPTAAAEMAVPVRHELLAQVTDDGARLTAAAHRRLDEGRLRLQGLVRGLPDLGRMVDERTQRLDDWSERLGNALELGIKAKSQELAAAVAGLRKPTHQIAQAGGRLEVEAKALDRAMRERIKDGRQRLDSIGALLESYSYQRVLDRGFALVTDAEGKTVASVASVAAGDDVALRLADGSVGAQITGDGVSSEPKQKPKSKFKSKSKSKPGGGDDRQGSLL